MSQTATSPTDLAAPPTEGQKILEYISNAHVRALELKEHAGRSEAGRQLAIVVTEIEKLRALLVYYDVAGYRILPT